MNRRPGASVGDGERERVRLVLRRAAQHGRREHEQLVGERADGGEHPGAAHHDPVVVLADHVRHQGAAALLAAGHGAVRLRRDEGVRAQQVLLADLLVVGGDIAGEGGVGLPEPVGGGRQRHQRAVQVVAGPAEHAERRVRPQLERLTPLDQVGGGPRDEERGRHGLAGQRRGVGQDVAVLRGVLHVEQRRVGRAPRCPNAGCDAMPPVSVSPWISTCLRVLASRCRNSAPVRAGMRTPLPCWVLPDGNAPCGSLTTRTAGNEAYWHREER